MLTHAQRMELEAAFRRFDIDGNGSIDSTELQTVMQQLGSAANEQTEELLNSMDLDKNGRVEWNEFALLMADRWIRQDGQTDIEMAMTLFLSESGQGVLDLKKMRELLCTTGEAPLSEEEFDQIAAMADPEGWERCDRRPSKRCRAGSSNARAADGLVTEGRHASLKRITERNHASQGNLKDSSGQRRRGGGRHASSAGAARKCEDGGGESARGGGRAEEGSGGGRGGDTGKGGTGGT